MRYADDFLILFRDRQQAQRLYQSVCDEAADLRLALNESKTEVVDFRYTTLLLRQAGFVPSIGILHRPRRGHASLASDLQEPFRHLMDRVIEATHSLCRDDFEKTARGPLALRVLPGAARKFHAMLHRQFALAYQSGGGDDPVPYRAHIARQAQSLRRCLLEGNAPFHAFEHL